MVLREYILCPGCAAKTELKVQIGGDEIQNFYFVCQKCDAVTNGSLKVDFKTTPPKILLRIEDSHSIGVSDENVDQTIIISTDFPCPINRESSMDFSAFLENAKIFDDSANLIEYGNRLGLFRSFLSSDWNKLKRLLTYYSKRNWNLFDKEWSAIYPSSDRPQNDFERHDQLHRTLEVMFLPLLNNDDYLAIKVEMSTLITNVAETEFDQLKLFVGNHASSSELSPVPHAIY